MSDETHILTPEALDGDFDMLTRYGDIQRWVATVELATDWRKGMRARGRKAKVKIRTVVFPYRGRIQVLAERPGFEPTPEQRDHDLERLSDVLARIDSQ
jgi:hypothetical protein